MKALFTGILALFFLTLLALAQENTIKQLEDRIKKIAVTNEEIADRINAHTKEAQRLRLARQARPDQGACDVCATMVKENCNISKAAFPEDHVCALEDCSVSLQPAANICDRLYRAKTCYENALTASLRVTVNKCWRVANRLDAERLEAEAEALSQQQKTLDEKAKNAVAKLDALEDEYRDTKDSKADAPQNTSMNGGKKKGDLTK